MAKDNRGGKRANKIVGDKGTGIKLTLSGKEQTLFVDASGFFREYQSATKKPITKENAQRLVKEGKATFVTKKEMDKIRKDRIEERKNKPDYELGNAFNEHGWGARAEKSVYRPKHRAR